MKTKYFFIIILVILFNIAESQNVSISDDATYTPASSSMLDVKSTNKGILIPRIVLNNRALAAPVTSPVEGLLIYNDGGTEPEGFWYWTGTQWKRIASNDGNVSLERNPMGEIYMEGNATVTTIAATNTYYKIAGTTTLNTSYQVDMPSSNNIRYTGSMPKMFHVACTFSLLSANANKNFKLKIYKYDASATTYSALNNSIVHFTATSSSAIVSTAIHVMVELDTNDFLELRIANLTSADNATITDMNFFMMGVSMGMDY